MALNLRTDQQVTFTVEWKDSRGNATEAPADTTPYSADSTVAKVEDLGGGTYKVTPLAPAEQGLGVGVTSPSLTVSDVLYIEDVRAASGSVVWGTPEQLA